MMDLIVIGAGLSGLMAAHAAAAAGLKTKIIAKGLGALHWSAGTIDVYGYAPGAEERLIRRPLEALAELTAMRPEHPYAHLGADAVVKALAEFQALSVQIGLPYAGSPNDGDNLLLPSPVGASRPAYLAPAGQLAGALDRTEPMLIVGFEGMRDFYPMLLAENLAKQDIAARAVLLPFDLLTERRDSNTVQLAHELEQPERTARLVDALRGVVQPGERIGLPAILGVESHADVIAALEQELRAPIFEIPTLPPSVPGIRLFLALRTHLQQIGVRIEAGMAVIAADAAAAVDPTPTTVRWVASETSARPLKHRADHFVLATGGVLGGGFNSDHTGRVWETIFDLPLTVPQARSQWFRPRFLDEAGHPVFQGGVAVDEQFRAVGADGTVCYANLRAVGGTLAGYDPIVERSMEGVAVATGMAAGRAIAQAQNETMAKIED